jgi:hypothetical protein
MEQFELSLWINPALNLLFTCLLPCMLQSGEPRDIKTVATHNQKTDSEHHG